PAVCMVAQGAKVVMVGRDVLEYDPAHVLVLAVDLPFSIQEIRASRKKPYLGLILDLDAARVAELATRVYPRGVPRAYAGRARYDGRSTAGVVDALARLLEGSRPHRDADMLGPV